MSELRGVLAKSAAARVMVVDDNAANTALVAKVLTRAGLNDVLEVNDPMTVAGLLDDHDPDLVLLDLRMPGLDGFAVLEVVQRYAAGTYLPVIIITADDTHASVERALSLGAHDFVRKPFDAIELALRVRNLLASRFAYLELRRHRAWLRSRLDLFQPDLAGMDDENAGPVRNRILQVMADDEVRIAFQPVVDMRDGTVISAEALARFPTDLFPGPAGWFAAALELGLGPAMELHCLLAALRLVHLRPPGTAVAVNASPQLLINGLADRMPPSTPWERLVLELTEHVPVEDYGVLNEALAPLRERGVRVAVDDTGAGFASLRHILDLHPDVIKIDIGIVRGIDSDPTRAAIAEMLVGFARRLGLRLVAEGVETEAERDALLELGVVQGQGYLFGRPELSG
jgi:EAL domain-containing protein (putative c-di-GMP-specific phosphodiesterase class I)/DNA-binding NarL/FixJ family response regulator